jgi:hypothetical protein
MGVESISLRSGRMVQEIASFPIESNYSENDSGIPPSSVFPVSAKICHTDSTAKDLGPGGEGHGLARSFRAQVEQSHMAQRDPSGLSG